MDSAIIGCSFPADSGVKQDPCQITIRRRRCAVQSAAQEDFMASTVVDLIAETFAARGATAYFGECVSMREHALQTAHFARRDAASPELVLAALLHDVGHLLENAPDDLDEWTDDACHESIGSAWLATRFPPAVVEPVRLHVAAKRYLCATDPGYRNKLSPASVITLGLQGGPMTTGEIAAFETEPYHRDAVQLRQWDDTAKIVGLITPQIADYTALIRGVGLK